MVGLCRLGGGPRPESDMSTHPPQHQPVPPRVEYLRMQNYRALKDLELKGITPLTAFLGPNGSGKSTIFDVFAFLSECFSAGLRKAWDRRGRFRELRTRGQQGPIVIELKYRERPAPEPKSPLITYHLAIDEGPRGPHVVEEWLQWRRQEYGRPFRFLDFHNGSGSVVTGEMPDEQDRRVEERLASPEVLAVNTLGQLAKHPRVTALRRLSPAGTSPTSVPTTPEASPRPGPKSASLKRATTCPTSCSI